jgi:PPOX class probable F420-dependent enzyme
VTAAEARDRFAAGRVARLATADAAGQPHLVPVVFALAGETVYSAVDTKPKRSISLRRLSNVRENPKVALLVDQYDDADWDALWWARADGRGRVLDAAESEAVHAVALLSERYPQQHVVGEVLAVDVERWSGWAARSVS